jgi:hypothetical protein
MASAKAVEYILLQVVSNLRRTVAIVFAVNGIISADCVSTIHTFALEDRLPYCNQSRA